MDREEGTERRVRRKEGEGGGRGKSPSPSPRSTETSQPLAGTFPAQQIKLPGAETSEHTSFSPTSEPSSGRLSDKGLHSLRRPGQGFSVFPETTTLDIQIMPSPSQLT